MTSQKTLFISDLHLDEHHPAATQIFLSLLTSCDAASVDAIYILGDLFEAWIGDDDDTAFHRTIIQALHTLTSRGIPVYFLPGNRDFLIGKKFLKATGCKKLPDEARIMLYGKPVLLMHGDTLCTQDLAYLAWRKKSRNPILYTLLFLILPLSLRRQFANKMRKKSAHYTQSVRKEIMDVTQNEVERVMKKHDTHFLIHGHTHRPDIHHFSTDGMNYTRIVLGAWHSEGSVLVWQESGEYELASLSA